MKLIQELEVMLHQHEVRTSKDRLCELLHPAFIEIGYSGTTYSYTSIISALLTEKPPMHRVLSQDFECSRLTATTRLLLYKSVNSHDDGSYSRYAKRSSVWVNEKDHWQLTFHQATPVAAFKLANV